MRDRFLTHWRGIALSIVGIVATLWLAVTGQLGLYIHPRYFAFTTIMAGVAVVFVVLAFLLVPTAGADAEHDAHDHGHDHGADQGPVARAWWFGLSIVLVAVTAGALLVLPPATLTTATVDQRVMNSSVTGQSLGDTIELAGGDEESFTVKDWAGLLRQGADERTLAGKSPTLVGFVTPDTDDPENVFYVARFVVTCCAVDAQPVGVPVYLPGWQDRFPIDEWVSVTGTFTSNPSVVSMQATVLTPREIAPTEQPADPYVY